MQLPPAADLAAYASVIVLVGGAISKFVSVLSKKRSEREEINEQLNTAPMERESMYLGNIGKKVTELNRIINSQSEHITRQDVLIKSQDEELVRVRLEVTVLRAKLEGTVSHGRQEEAL